MDVSPVNDYSLLYSPLLCLPGLHYVAVNLGWDIIGARWNDGNSVSIDTFVSALPAVVLNNAHPLLPLSDIRQRCSCGNLCHTRMGTFIQMRPDLVQEVLTPLYAAHLPRMKPISLRDTFLHSGPASATQQPDTTPAIPVRETTYL